MRTTILGGVLFLVPLVFITLILGRGFEITRMVAKPFYKFLPLDHIGGIAIINILAIILLFLVCYLAGLAATHGAIAKRVKKAEDLLINIIPGYAVTKGVLGGATKNDDAMSVLRPVFVKFDDYEQLAFEIERTEDKVVIFLPGAPSAWSGTSVIVDVARVTALDLPPHKIVGLLRVMGRGTFALQAQGGGDPAVVVS
ncbi:MAG: hypothetical protein ACU0CA_15840 [Paracoccaceae bacterium]